MARPVNKEHRTQILNALDKKFANTIKDVQESTGNTYQSTRRMLLTMVREGTVVMLPQRGDNNEMLFTKGTASPFVVMTTYEGDPANLSEFISNTYASDLSPLVGDEARLAIKKWMFDYLVSAR